MSLLLGASTGLSDKVLVEDIVGGNDLLFEAFLFLLALFLILSVLVSLALVVGIFVIDAIIEILIVEFFILTVKLANTGIEANGHILVH